MFFFFTSQKFLLHVEKFINRTISPCKENKGISWSLRQVSANTGCANKGGASISNGKWKIKKFFKLKNNFECQCLNKDQGKDINKKKDNIVLNYNFQRCSCPSATFKFPCYECSGDLLSMSAQSTFPHIIFIIPYTKKYFNFRVPSAIPFNYFHRFRGREQLSVLTKRNNVTFEKEFPPRLLALSTNNKIFRLFLHIKAFKTSSLSPWSFEFLELFDFNLEMMGLVSEQQFFLIKSKTMLSFGYDILILVN